MTDLNDRGKGTIGDPGQFNRPAQDPKQPQHGQSLETDSDKPLSEILDEDTESAFVAALAHPEGRTGVHRLNISPAELEHIVESGWQRIAAVLGSKSEESAPGSANQGDDKTFQAPRLRSPRRSHDETRFSPLYLPPGFGCKIPVERLAGREFRDDGGIAFGEIKFRNFGKLPEPAILSNEVPLVVTTPLRVLIEHERGAKWSVALPLAPQKTRIVTRHGSPLADLKDYALAAQLGGRRIAVADAASGHAARLASAARRYGFMIEVTPRSPKKPASNTLYLVTKGFHESGSFGRILSALERGSLDGFATVEPYPTLAFFHFTESYREAILDHLCTSASTGLCCVVAVPTAIVEDTRYSDAYKALVREVLTSLCRLIGESALDDIRQVLAPSIRALLPRAASEQWLEHIVAKSAATMVAHLTAMVTPLNTLGAQEIADVERVVESFAPMIGQEAMSAEFEALASSFSRELRQSLRVAASGRRPLKELYPTHLVREVFRSVITERVVKGISLAQKAAQDSLAESAEPGRAHEPPDQLGAYRARKRREARR